MLSIDLSDKAIVVTGAAGGLGKACVDAVIHCGGSVIASDVDKQGLQRLKEEITSDSQLIQVFEVDVSRPESARSLLEFSLSRSDNLFGLVNCIGVHQTIPFVELTADAWRRVIDINLNGMFYLVQTIGQYLYSLGRGAIVNFSSVAGRGGRANAAHYAASKAGVISLTRSAALAFAPYVRVNAVCPGVFMTPMWQRTIAERDEKFGPGEGQKYLDSIVSKTPLGRVGKVEEVAYTVVFLLSDLASFITGQSINIDGGLEMD